MKKQSSQSSNQKNKLPFKLSIIQPVLITLLMLCQGCLTAIPTGIQPVRNFEIERYLGTWHEIARLDHSFERGLEQVTATYTLKEDGSIKVENAGTNSKTGKRKIAVGKAKPVKDATTAHLKVSFFGPFYASYIVFYLENDYSVALVSGSNKDYCWILARKPVLTPQELEKYCNIAKEHGFAAERFIYPKPYHAVGS
jgi:apolipoprotein D and lipocalin family protein